MRKPSLHTVIVAAAFLIVFAPLFVMILKIFVLRDVPFLRSEAGARWIKVTEPVSLRSWTGTFVVDYRKQFILKDDLQDVPLTVRAFRSAQVYLDGQLISPYSDSDTGNLPRSVKLGNLASGPHELGIAVKNENGPALLLAYSSALRIFTGPGWEVSLDGTNWLPATLAEERRQADLSLKFPTTFGALRSLLPVYLPLFIVAFLIALFFRSLRERYRWMGSISLHPSQVRWLLLAAWTLLAVNNIGKIPLDVGFDAVPHYKYITYVAKNGTIPLATEGWQMFQSPLYYLLSAGLVRLLSLFLPLHMLSYVLRIIPLLSGALQVQLVYLAMKYVFPDRRDLQTMGILVGGFLPMNFYMSQVVGNEPLAGFLSAAAIVLALGILHQAGRIPKKKIVFLGIMTGLACLTKVSAVLLIPALCLVLLYKLSRNEESSRAIIAGLLLFIGAVTIVSGWYYLRNWIILGRPFVGGWDTSRGIMWWQEPGYRTVRDFFSFGQSLYHPVFSALNGFWDSIYSTFWLDGLNSSMVTFESNPPWNYEFMISGALFALLPSIGIALGFLRSLRGIRTARPGEVFAAFCIALYGAALLSLFVAVPIYSTAKATYTLGLIPCYAILCAAGLDLLTRTRYARATVYALLACWTLSVYSSYFVL